MRRVPLLFAILAGCSSPKHDCPEPAASAPVLAAGTETANVPSGSATASDQATPAVRASRGELRALKELERIPASERSVEQSAAIARGHALLGKEAAATLGRDIQANPALLDDRNVLAQLFGYAKDPVIAESALPVIAGIERPVGPDMLYEVWKHDAYAPSRSLAEDLLFSRVVKQRASKELEFVIALEREERCEKLKRLLEDDGDKADRRALSRLEALEKKDGCEKNDAGQDCYACLREGDALSRVKALVEKQKKKPAAWEIRRR